jgi:N-methylhydantoinase A
MNVLGVDVGGTFTDAVLLADGELRTAKVPTARRQEESVLAAARAAGAAEVGRFTHGTTVATNALLERKGARTAFVSTAGFEHLLHLRRQNRAQLYRLCVDHPTPLVPLERCFGVRERIGPEGVVARLELGSLPELDEEVDAVAVCLLFAFRDPSHERAVTEELRRRLPGRRVVASHEVAPEFREYERASTTTIDAYLGPVVSGYLEALRVACGEAGLPQPLVMASSGGVVSLEEAAAHPARALVSGPAAGVVGAAWIARLAGLENAISLDMGGTSTDVCLISGGVAGRAAEREVAGLPVRLPAVDLQTVGAGGGSIVWRDVGGALRVGPESAGAEPGPACYGRGGSRPTVTDANLLLGRLPERIAGGLELDRVAAERAFGRIDPEEAVAVVNAEMLRALRLVSVERGLDPRDFALVAFGGAGPLHACALLTVPLGSDLAGAFHRAHEARYGYAGPERPVELVAVRTAEVRPGPNVKLPPAEPLDARGPTRIELEGATCWLPPGWVGVRDGTSSTLRVTKVSRERGNSGT